MVLETKQLYYLICDTHHMTHDDIFITCNDILIFKQTLSDDTEPQKTHEINTWAQWDINRRNYRYKRTSYHEMIWHIDYMEQSNRS